MPPQKHLIPSWLRASGELGEQGIDVLASCAGAIRTPGYLSAQAGGEAPGILDASAVAEQTLDALGAGPVVVPGTLNKLASFVMAAPAPALRSPLMSNNTRELTG